MKIISRFGTFNFYGIAVSLTILICFTSFITVSRVDAQATSQVIGTISMPTFNCLYGPYAANDGAPTTQNIYNTGNQLNANSGGVCPSVYDYPYFSTFPDVVTLTTSD